jgi:transcriptional regulator with XRE-family HTH domain
MTEGDAAEAHTESIRTALWRYLESGSLRAAAREVGMSPTGLSNFLHGGMPRGPTLKKLREWYRVWGSG